MKKYTYLLIALGLISLHACKYKAIQGKVADYVSIKPQNDVYEIPADGKTLLPMEAQVSLLSEPNIDVKIGSNAGMLITSDFMDTARVGSTISLNLHKQGTLFYLLCNPEDIDRQKVFFYMMDVKNIKTEFDQGILIKRSLPSGIRIEIPVLDSLDMNDTLDVSVYVSPVPVMRVDSTVILTCKKADSIPACHVLPSTHVPYNAEGKATFRIKANGDGIIKLTAQAAGENGMLTSDTTIVYIK